MQKFCTKCGQKLDEKTGLCPNCDKGMSRKEKRTAKKGYKKSAKKEKKAEKWARLTIGQKIKKVCLRIIAAILALAIVIGAATVTLVYFDIIDIPAIDKVFVFLRLKEDTPDANGSESNNTDVKDSIDTGDISSGQYTVDHPDADEYFSKNSTIISEVEIINSTTVLSEKDAYNVLNERGFTNYPITVEYSMDGQYSNAKEISSSSDIKHPIYQTNYLSPNGEMWTIYLIENFIMADPISYNIQSELNIQVIISETDSIMSYDSATNKFYETIPNESQLKVKKIKRIDAGTIDTLNIGVIGEL